MARELWGSRLGFILATAGFAIGLGNIWRFPYMVGTYGGGAFLLVYLAFALLIGIPLLTAEVSLGREAGASPIAGMRRLTGSARSPWNLIAWCGVAAGVLIQSYYVMVIGWILGYTALVCTGGLDGHDSDALAARHAEFVATPGPVILCTALVLMAVAAIVARGLHRGLERASKIAMPLLLLLLILLAARSLSFEGAGAGLAWYLTPDFSMLDGRALLAALGQAFYSIGIGSVAAFGFGSYLHRERSDIPGNTAIVVACDTGVALLAGLVIFPALFAFGLEPDAGPGLLFLTMPQLFAQMPAGQIFGAVFFVLLLLAALTSSAGLHEALTATWTDLRPVSRGRASWILAVLFFVLSIPIILSQGPWSHFRLLGLDLFQLVDTISANVLLPVGALILVFYITYAWTFETFRRDTNRGAGSLRVGAAWKPLIAVGIPLAVLLVLLSGLGLV